MALVLFFVPNPAKGVAEMARVVKPGGTVAAYAWDMLGGGFPQEPIFERAARDGPCRARAAASGGIAALGDAGAVEAPA